MHDRQWNLPLFEAFMFYKHIMLKIVMILFSEILTLILWSQNSEKHKFEIIFPTPNACSPIAIGDDTQ
jgi:hypothetical protein